MVGVRRALCALFVVVATLGVAVPAAAWERAGTLSPGANGPNDLELVVTSQGETVAAWIEQNHEDIRAFAAVLRADGTLEPAVELARNLGGCVLDIATDAQGTVIVALSHSDGRIAAFRRPAGGTFGEAEIVNAGLDGGGWPRVAMGADGSAAVLLRQFSSDGQDVKTVIHTSGGPGQWSTGQVVSSDPEFGGYDVGVTPQGAAVAVWIVDAPTEDGGGGGPLGDPLAPAADRKPSAVKAATLFPDGTVSGVQVLRDSTSTKTCPQVEANAQGQVAALWHEVESTQCGAWGGDVLALRGAGATGFEAPQTVPGAQSAAALGVLGLADDGRLTVTYDGSNGGQLVSGPFGGELFARQMDAPPVAAGADPAGVDLIAVRTGNGYATVRHAEDGQVSAPVPFGASDMSDYVRVDEAAGRAAALALYDGGLQLLQQAADTAPPPGEPPPAGPPSSPPGTGQPSLPGDALSVGIRRVRLQGRRVLVDVHCSRRCTVAARMTLGGRRGRRAVLRTRSRSFEGGGRLSARLSKRLARRLGRERRVAVARIEAKGPAGERAAAVLRPARRRR